MDGRLGRPTTARTGTDWLAAPSWSFPVSSQMRATWVRTDSSAAAAVSCCKAGEGIPRGKRRLTFPRPE